MTWQRAAFRQFFIEKVGTENSANSYATSLRKVDEFCGGLDEKINAIGSMQVIAWAKLQTDGPFADQPSSTRSAIKCYIRFLLDAADPESIITDNDVAPSENETELEATVFRYEKELQSAVRRQIDLLETGLIIADGGVERSVATGRIDILAEDQSGSLVVIELKAGRCPAGALEQALGYSDDIHKETGKSVRTLLVASEFPDRIRAAARRVANLHLVIYKINLAFTQDALN